MKTKVYEALGTHGIRTRDLWSISHKLLKTEILKSTEVDGIVFIKVHTDVCNQR